MIEGFVLPEVLAFAREDGVGLMRGRTLDSIRYVWNGDLWRDEQVNMIGHHNEGVEGKIAQDGITFANRVDDSGGDARLL